MLAFFNLGPGEIILLLILGVVLFGRDLPSVGRKVGHTVANLRRSLNEFKQQLDADDSIREIRKSMNETRTDLNKITKVPRVISNPSSLVKDFAKEAMQPLPEDAEAAPEEERKVPDGAVPAEDHPHGDDYADHHDTHADDHGDDHADDHDRATDDHGSQDDPGPPGRLGELDPNRPRP